MPTPKPTRNPIESSNAVPSSRTTDHDSEALCRALCAMDADAPSLLWSRYAAHVRRVLRRMLRPDPDLEDLTQEVFLRAFQRVGTVREPTSIGGFLHGIAVNVALDERRRRRRRVPLWLDVDAVTDAVAVAQVDFQARRSLRRLIQVLEQLTPKMRTAFVLREIEEVEIADIARALDCSVATAKRMIVKARAIVTAAARRDPALSSFVSEVTEIAPLSHSP